jgi:hypothetical protein
MKAKGDAKDFPVVCVGGSAGGLDAYFWLYKNDRFGIDRMFYLNPNDQLRT